MKRQISKRQTKRRRSIFQIVHKECRHGLKSLQLFSPRNFVRELQVQQTYSNLIADALQQIECLEGVRRAADAICQNGNSQAAASSAQRNTDSISSGAKLIETDLLEGLNVSAFGFFQIKRLLEHANVCKVLLRILKHRAALIR